MTRRIAASFGLIVFATVVLRALLGLVVTFGVGLILGVMAEKMLKENLEPSEKSEKTSN
jgi:hypothetical protein